MGNKTLVTLTTLIFLSAATHIAYAAQQDIIIMGDDPNIAITTTNFPTNPSIDWPSLCLAGQLLTDSAGCTPDCAQGSTAITCQTLIRAGQIENLTGVRQPYLRTGMVVFKLTQLAGVGTFSVFNVTLNQKPSGYGYMCEILNANGTPATLWDTTTHPPIPTSIITLDSNISGPPFKSDDFVTTVTQPAGGVAYWYKNPNNPLYMACVGYTVSAPNTLQSNTACGGSGPVCVSYTLQ